MQTVLKEQTEAAPSAEPLKLEVLWKPVLDARKDRDKKRERLKATRERLAQERAEMTRLRAEAKVEDEKAIELLARQRTRLDLWERDEVEHDQATNAAHESLIEAAIVVIAQIEAERVRKRNVFSDMMSRFLAPHMAYELDGHILRNQDEMVKFIKSTGTWRRFSLMEARLQSAFETRLRNAGDDEAFDKEMGRLYAAAKEVLEFSF